MRSLVLLTLTLHCACQVTAVLGRPSATLGAATDLASLGGGANCWYATMARSASTDSGGTSWLIAAEHAWCGSQTDRVIAYSSNDLATWTSEQVYVSAYAGDKGGEPWSRGIPSFVATAGDAHGNVHAVFEERAGTGYWAPGAIRYAYRKNGAWTVAPEAFDDRAIQGAEGNVRGEGYSGIGGVLGFDATESLLRFIGTDGAWYAVRWHAIASDATPFSSFGAPNVVYTRNNGTLDRGAVVSADEDFSNAEGVQAFIDMADCALMIRLRSDGAFTDPPSREPLGFPACTTDAASGYGFSAEAQAVVGAGGAQVFVFARSTAGTLRSLIRFSHGKNGWSRSTLDWSGIDLQKVFATSGGTVGIVRASGGARVVDVTWPDTGLVSPLTTLDRSATQLDLSRHAPAFLGWAETDGSTQFLRTAPFHIEVP